MLNFAVMFVGSVAAKGINILFENFVIGNLRVQPVYIGIVLLVLMMPKHIRSGRFLRQSRAVSSFIGICSETVVYVIYSTNLGTLGREIMWSVKYEMDVIFLLVIAAVVQYILAHSKLPEKNSDNISEHSNVAFLVGCFGSIIMYRMYYIITADIPNEDSSAFVGGMEIHHIVFGLIGLIMFLLLAERGLAQDKVTFWLLLGVYTGTVIDQAYYCLRIPVDHQSYGALGNIVAIVYLLAYVSITPHLKKG